MNREDLSPCLRSATSSSIAHASPNTSDDLKYMQLHEHQPSVPNLELRGGFGGDALWTASDRAIDCALEVAVCSETSACSFMRTQKSYDDPRNRMWDWRGSRERYGQGISSPFQVAQGEPSRPGDADHAFGAPPCNVSLSGSEINIFENQHEDYMRNRLESIFRRDAAEEATSTSEDRGIEDSIGHGKQAQAQQAQSRCNTSQDGVARADQDTIGKAGSPKVEGVLAYASSSNYFGHGGSSRSTYRASRKQQGQQQHSDHDDVEVNEKNSIGKMIRDSVSDMCSRLSSILSRDSRDKDSLRNRQNKNRPLHSTAIGSKSHCNKALQRGEGADGGGKAGLSVKARFGIGSAARASEMEGHVLNEKLQQVIKRATVLKDKGSSLYKQGRFEQAIMQYDIAKRIVELEGKKFESDSVESKVSIRFMIACYLNLAASCIEIGDYFSAIKHCTRVLEMDCDNHKGKASEQASPVCLFAQPHASIHVCI
jgi:tetratricopeptide (TPR) repeat protein